ncbi:MAG: SpoIID/LytB domain-containing protein [Synechococcus sp.]
MNRIHNGQPLRSLVRSLVVLGLVMAGCQGQEAAAPLTLQRSALPTHRAVPSPPPVTADQLWVALDDHLGQGTRADQSAAPLRLRSAGAAPLLLRAVASEPGASPLAQAAALQISWRLVPLPQAVQVSRLVAGPYASFESADRVAERWRGQGVTARVAHPGEWEVWVPADAPALDGVITQPWQQTINAEVRPHLEGAQGGQTLTGALVLEAPDGLRWKGGVMQGPFRLQPDAYGSWTLLEQVPLERYLEGVVPHEIGAASPSAALQAQSVLARTWALANSHRFGLDGYHLCSDTQCQVYSDPRQAGSAVRQAIAATSGLVLQWQGKPISAVYHASNGGVMASAPEAWAMAPAAYLQAQPDGDQAWRQQRMLPLDATAVDNLLQGGAGAYGASHPLFRWQRTYSAAQLQVALAEPDLGTIQQLTVLDRGPSGRVLRLRLSGDGPKASVTLRLDAIRRRLRRLPSTLFVVRSLGPGRWQFQGGGFGHGAGLSQAGAIDLARRGWPLKRILNHYYPGATLAPVSTAGKVP